MGARRQAEVDPLEHAAVSVRRGRDRRPHRRGRRRRRAHPADAHRRSQRRCGRRIPDEPRLMIRRDPDRDRRHATTASCPKARSRTTTASRCASRSRKQGLDLNRNFPGELAAGVRAARRRPVSDVGARGARGRRLHRRAIRTSPAASSFHTWSGVLLRPFEHQPDDEMHAEDLWLYQARRQEGHRAHRLSGHLGLPRVPLSPEAGDRRHVRLGLRAPRHVQLGGRDLAPDARSGHRRATSTSTGSATIRSRTT